MPRPELAITVALPDGGEFALVELRGSIDCAAVTRVHRRLGVLLLTGVRFIVVDVSAVECFEAPVWAVLTDVRQRLAHRQGWLRLIGTAGAPADGIVASLADLFALYRSVCPVRHAVAAARPRPRPPPPGAHREVPMARRQ